LAYRLHSISDRKGWTSEALAYNTLVQNWPEIERLAREIVTAEPSERQERLL
ncbi:MAG: hypothetical protein IT335_12735, partial [Thermomicrobiales bacterium]|nr:hypothetical protein [Thermomicrobiales bacterium]